VPGGKPAAPAQLSCEGLRKILIDKEQGIGPGAADWLTEPLGPRAPSRLELLHLALVSGAATADKRAACRAALLRKHQRAAREAAGRAARRYLTKRSAAAHSAAKSTALEANLADPAYVREFALPVHPALARQPPNVKHRATRYVYQTLRAFLPHASKRGLLRATVTLIPHLTGKKEEALLETIEKALRAER
jgi:hypothetical protein